MTYKGGLEILKKGDSLVAIELYRLGGMNMLTDVLKIADTQELPDGEVILVIKKKELEALEK